jgi:hypothetical protein
MKPEAQGTKTLTNIFFFHTTGRAHISRKSGSHNPEYGHVPLSHTLLPFAFT